jgi:hypothetical protein
MAASVRDEDYEDTAASLQVCARLWHNIRIVTSRCRMDIWVAISGAKKNDEGR